MSRAALRDVAGNFSFINGIVAPVLRGGNEAAFNKLHDRPGPEPQPVGGFCRGQFWHCVCTSRTDVPHENSIPQYTHTHNTNFPYHPMLASPSPTGLYPLDSAGSCLVMRGVVALAARFQPDDGIVGWGRDMREKGYQLWLDPTVKVEHP